MGYLLHIRSLWNYECLLDPRGNPGYLSIHRDHDTAVLDVICSTEICFGQAMGQDTQKGHGTSILGDTQYPTLAYPPALIRPVLNRREKQRHWPTRFCDLSLLQNEQAINVKNNEGKSQKMLYLVRFRQKKNLKLKFLRKDKNRQRFC